MDACSMLLRFDCAYCGRMCGKASPFALKRCCTQCAERKEAVWTINQTSAREAFLLSETQLSAMRSLNVRAMIAGGSARGRGTTSTVFSLCDVRDAAMAKWGSVEKLAAEATKRNEKSQQRLKSKLSLGLSNSSCELLTKKEEKQRNKRRAKVHFDGDLRKFRKRGNHELIPLGFVFRFARPPSWFRLIRNAGYQKHSFVMTHAARTHHNNLIPLIEGPIELLQPALRLEGAHSARCKTLAKMQYPSLGAPASFDMPRGVSIKAVSELVKFVVDRFWFDSCVEDESSDPSDPHSYIKETTCHFTIGDNVRFNMHTKLEISCNGSTSTNTRND